MRVPASSRRPSRTRSARRARCSPSKVIGPRWSTGCATPPSQPQVEWRHGRVDRVVHTLVRQQIHADLVVLDPPRTGAGRDVTRDIAALHPRRIAYVACDPAALARDVAYLGSAGYRLETLRAFDAFPMTHHVECIAVLVPE